MSGVIEVRTYRAKSGKRAELLAVFAERVLPAQARLGIRVLGPLPSREDDETFVWLRAFPDDASRESLKSAFYGGSEWTNSLAPVVLPLLDKYDAVVVDDSLGLWSVWPAL
jgi:hypothetical protein